MIPKVAPCFVQLGRFGDLIQMLPAFKAIFDRTNERPVVAVSTEYASVLDGISYVLPWVLNLPWSTGVAHARGIVEIDYPSAISLQFWNDSKRQFASEVMRQAVTLQCHGESWRVDLDKWPDYGTAMWSLAGFNRQEMLDLPLEFDLRDLQREQTLANLTLHRTLPNILVNWKGISSPFPMVPEYQRILGQYRKRFHFVDLATVKAHRIYDLLGLYDRAVGLITVDTATLHLAPASKVPYIAFTRGDWSGSIPKGRCVCRINYHEAEKRMGYFKEILDVWAACHDPQRQPALR